MENFQSLVSIAPWNFIGQICNLFITMWLFKKFLFKPVKAVIAKRQEQVDAIYKDAQIAKDSAQSKEVEYTALLDGAKSEAAEMVRSATTTAQTRSDDMIRQAKSEASAIKAKASADIAMERKKTLNQVKDDISTIAMDIASKVVEREVKAEDHQALVEDFIAQMGDGQ